MKQSLFQSMIGLLLALMLPTCAWAADEKTPEVFADYPTWYDYRDKSFSIDGKGTLDNPIVINTAEELAQLAYLYNTADPVDNINNLEWKKKVIVIGSDINLEKTVNGQRVQWIPIGYGNAGFQGAVLGINSKESLTANSKRHQIRGMYIHLTASDLAKAKFYQFGLFSILSGYVGFLDITDASISLNFSSMTKSSQVGILSGNSTGSGNYRTQPIQVNASTSKDVKVAIESVGVKGDIDVETQNSTYSIYIGGISGVIDHHGVFHSTASVNINSTDCKYVGGICGYVNTNNNAEYITSIVDCLVQATINSSYNPSNNNEDIANIGGICGIMNYSPCTGLGFNKIEASSSMGSISVSGNAYLGGICGYLNQACQIGGCTSSALLSGGKYLGGICGYIYDNTAFQPDDTHEMIVPLEDCAFSGHIDANQTEYAGGLCGYSMEEKDLHINSSLFAGTMTIGNAQHAAAIVGYTPKPDENVGGCYYDASLFTGNVVCDNNTHSSVKGLITDVLTSGELNSVSMLNQDESTKHYFTLRKGYYPRMVSNRAYTPYYEQRNGAVTFSAILNSDAASESESPSCLFNSGSWLCSVPVNIPKGDTAYDLVTQVIAPSKNAAWTELNRTITVNSKVEYQNQSCIKISNDTAYAVANGTFITKITVNPDRPTAIWNRPLPISGTKQLLFTSTVDQVWDGSIADEFAAGSGKKEDPYIIKNGAQLAFAVKNNKDGEWYKQICDITLNKDMVNNGISSSSHKWFTDITWKACYNGDNHYVRGVEIPHKSGLFGNIEAYAEVMNLGVVDCYLIKESGAFAYQMNGKITNCIAEGLATPNNGADKTYYYLGYCGGFCALIGNTNPNAVIEDCVSAVGCDYFMMDYTPFVSLSDNNHGTVRHCLFVVPVGSDDATFSGTRSSASGHEYIKDCYWLKGYEPLNTGYTLEEICNNLAPRSRWVINNGYFPMLKSFANSDMGKLLSVPFRTDVDYVFDAENNTSSNYLLGFSNQLLFEPGSAQWTTKTAHIEADGDMGIIAPVSASYTPQTENPNRYNIRTIIGLCYLKGVLGKYQHYIPMRSSDQNVTPGISFVDDNARLACLAAFDSNGNGYLSLAELKAVSTEQTLTAFQTETARKIKEFPEFRFFKAVTELTTQLNGLSKLEEVKLPYALETLGSDAFDGCTSLKEVTIPAKVDVVEPHPFYGSVIENVSVDPFNENFVSRDGILFDTNNVLVAYPNGRTGEEAVITGTINEIAEGAIFKVNGVERLYFETDDYETVPYLWGNGIVSDNDELIDVYVSDATYESVLMQGYYDDGSWDEYINAGKLHCYYPLKVGSAKAATMYIGFDTELPTTLTPYIVTKTNGEGICTDVEDNESNTAYLLSMSRKVPSRSPVVIFAEEAGTYRLEPLDESLKPWAMYKNELNGVGRDGMPVNQGDSDRGYILTLGYNKDGELGFFYYTGARIAPYHAYLTHNETSSGPSSGAKYNIVFLDNETTGIREAVPQNTVQSDEWFDLSGRKLNGKPTQRGIYVMNGKIIVIK